jgi:hypothetical protein
MAKALAFAAGLAAVGLTACSPFGGGNFTCDTDEQCRAGAGGKCEPNGFCSFTDPSCASGQRYEEHSGGLSGICVGDEPVPGEAGGELCYGTGLVKPCFPTAPTDVVTLTSSIDTGSSMCSTTVTAANDLCVIAGSTIQVPANMTIGVTGAKPLVLVATAIVEISGTLDAASHNGATNGFPTAQVGAGSNPGGCNMGTPAAAANSGGGGAGGSFGGVGGNGGNGVGAAATGGMAGPMLTPTVLRGGCPGQDGINGTFGTGGHGGGAVYLIAGTEIRISGTLNASGEGGLRGNAGGAGAGGGGSGGMIGLDSPMITNSGTVFANGGSGGQGSGQMTAGSTGPEPTGAGQAAPATSGCSICGEGGRGGARTMAAGNGQNGDSINVGGGNTFYGGGGGGGGSIGVIKVYGGGTLMGQRSPDPS